MAKGEIHSETGTICKAETDESCPLGGTGHVADLDGFAAHHNVDAATLKRMVVEGHMSPRAVIDLMGEDYSATPKPLTKSSQIPTAAATVPSPAVTPEPAPETDRQRYERELAVYVVELKAYEDRLMANYAAEIQSHSQSSFAPAPRQPPLRKVYPKSFEQYKGMVRDFLPESFPGANPTEEETDLWSEYLRKRSRVGDLSKDEIYYS